MEIFGAFLGHLIGTFTGLGQRDWMAKNKSNEWPGPYPSAGHADLDLQLAQCAWDDAYAKYWLGHLACTVHVLLNTFWVFVFSFWWMPIWGLLVIFATHWLIDRFRLARRFMLSRISGQTEFVNGQFKTWSVISVDQCMHLLVLYLVALIVLKG